MIKSFADRRTALLFQGVAHRSLPSNILTRARVKLVLIDQALDLDDLRSPPGNRLELRKGDRAGSYSIRVNGQWRLCFRWRGGDAFDVELADYHG
ncbi:MAG: type II toxin-antitoxin system RelE/ParE family toxin [Rhodospirillales bacterium]|nr:MAG: type II toxin-antitoxin system RelE/ParE family toxin [Rhodospirillales bacterium]